MGVDPGALSYDRRGLVPVVVQDVESGAVLMLAYANREAIERTLATGEAHFWSRSRQRLWRKGESSGHGLEVVEMLEDCDRDAVLLRAHPRGPTCHRLTRSCFEPNPAQLELGWLWSILETRRGSDLEASYTARLLEAGVDRIGRKLGEEATETVIAAVRADGAPAGASAVDPRREVVAEAADLLYHLLVLLQSLALEPRQVGEELGRRHRQAASTAEDSG